MEVTVNSSLDTPGSENKKQINAITESFQHKNENENMNKIG